MAAHPPAAGENDGPRLSRDDAGTQAGAGQPAPAVTVVRAQPAPSWPSPAEPAGLPTLRVAVMARTSTVELQDPTLSIPRQVTNSRNALPRDWVPVAYFYDVESGRLDPALRGHSSAHELFDIPVRRDGGIADLLAEARRPDRRFDAVICESIDRIARRTYYGTMIEHELEQAGVPLLAADEPIQVGRKKATRILTRRVKQATAEWYVLETQEKAWDGYCEHTRQGWNIGRPPYGYRADPVPHPVPARRAEGKTKHRLVPDPVTAPVVRQIFAWRVAERLGYKAIATRLNADPDRYPPPVSPDPARQRNSWIPTAVRDILLNPKYTGYMVWNRRATKSANGKVNQPATWVRSPEPTHQPLVSQELFDAAAAVARERFGSRTTPGANTAHPDTKRAYLFRSFVICSLCGRRMFGKTRREIAYYACQRRWTDHDTSDHPKSLWVRQQPLLEGVSQFFADHVFGPDRRSLLAATIGSADQQVQQHHQARIDALRRAVGDLEARQARLIHTLETHDDPDGTVFVRVQQRLHELHTEQQAKLAELDAAEDAQPTVATPAVELLDLLPIAPIQLAEVAEAPLRRLFEAFRLQIGYHKPSNLAVCRVILQEDSAPELLRSVGEVAETSPVGTGKPPASNGHSRSHALCALPRAPTEPLSEHPCWLLMAGLPAPGIPGTLISRLSTRSSWTRALMRRFRAGTGQFAWRCGPVRRGHPALGGWGSWRLVAASRDWRSSS